MPQQIQYTQTIIINSPMQPPTAQPPAGTPGTAYSWQETVTGGVAPLVYAATGLPPGLSLSAAGLITGTPTTPGSYTVVFIVHDSSP